MAQERHGEPSRGRVLVVDDSRLVRLMVTGILSRAGFEAEEADGGPAAMRLLAEKPYDVVVTDLKMPGMDGFEVLARVRSLSPNVEVIILTGSLAQDVSCAVRALRLGAHDYLSKPPSDPGAVALTVERAVEKKRLKEDNQRLLAELENMSRKDALTGAGNRRAFDESLAKELARARRHAQQLSLMMLDIDHFKRVNDTRGHAGGDEVLRSFARTIAATLREGDMLFRYGGEEFAVLLPHTDLTGAVAAAERVVAAVARTPVQLVDSVVHITTSAGVASLEKSMRQAGALVERADKALYEAKTGGRNRAVASRPLALVAIPGGEGVCSPGRRAS